MSRAKALNCRCNYKLPQAALRITLLNVSGKHGPERLLFAPICGRTQTPFAMEPPLDVDGNIADPEYGEVWSLPEDDAMVFVTGDPARPYIAKTTVSSLDVGGVVTELRYTDVDGLIAKYENMNPWQPNRGLCMRLVDYDRFTATAIRFQDYVCLRPAMNPATPGDCAECFTTDGLSVSDYSFLYVVTPGNYTDSDGSNECDCEHASRSMSGVGEIACQYVETRTECDGAFGYALPVTVELRPLTSSSCEIRYGIGDAATLAANHWSAFPERSACDIALHGGRFTLDWVVGTLPCDSTDPVTVEIIPLTSNGEVRASSVPCAPKYCGGASSWQLVEKCRANDTAIYEWSMLSDAACKGECSSDGCRATVPFQLQGAATFSGQSERISDDDATDLGYAALVSGSIAVDGGCDCEAAPADPVCGDGCSVWTPARALCDDGKYLYFWSGKNSSCAASCGMATCNPTIPESPVMPETTMSDVEAEAYFGMTVATLLATDYLGGCGCTDAYVAPECPPPCEDCTDVVGTKSFTVSGMTGGLAIFNGTYTLAKTGDCEWTGDNGNPLASATLGWVAGVWQLVFGNADSTTYQSSATACEGPGVMTKQGSGEETDQFPSTITVN